jgi:hypothetical protein
VVHQRFINVTRKDRKLAAITQFLTRLLNWVHNAQGAPRLVAVPQLPWRRVLPVALLGAAFAAIVVGHRVELPDRLDPIAPFEVGYHTGIHEALRERGLPISDDISQYGYDGQWFLGQANDPLILTDLPTTFDYPRYRSIRVMLPAAGWLLGAGQPAAIPYALLVVQIVAVGIGSAACARIVSAFRRSPWWGATFAVIPGVWLGVAFMTAEPLGVALAALGVSLMMDRRYGWAGLAFAGASLTKETYIAFAVGAAVFLAVDSHLRRRQWIRPALVMVAPAAASLVAWWAYVELSLPPDVNYGVFERFSPPFVGWADIFVSMINGGYDVNYPSDWGSKAVLISSFVVLLSAVVLGLWLRQTLMAYLAIGWGSFGLIIAGFLLERFTSAQRALAPAIFATGVFLLTIQVQRRRPPVAVKEEGTRDEADSRLVSP